MAEGNAENYKIIMWCLWWRC